MLEGSFCCCAHPTDQWKVVLGPSGRAVVTTLFTPDQALPYHHTVGNLLESTELIKFWLTVVLSQGPGVTLLLLYEDTAHP